MTLCLFNNKSSRKSAFYKSKKNHSHVITKHIKSHVYIRENVNRYFIQFDSSEYTSPVTVKEAM